VTRKLCCGRKLNFNVSSTVQNRKNKTSTLRNLVIVNLLVILTYVFVSMITEFLVIGLKQFNNSIVHSKLDYCNSVLPWLRSTVYSGRTLVFD